MEGAELSLIETIDWNLLNVKVVVVEAKESDTEKNEAVRAFMKRNGYTILGSEIPRSDLFVKENYDIVK